MGEQVRVPYGDKAGETATLLLAAAEDLDLDPAAAVRTSDGAFVVDEEVAKKAGVKTEEEESGPKAIDDMTKDELQAEIDARNLNRGDDDKIKPEGKNKPDLLKALQADDSKEE